ncbi:MAG: aldo/keto reductase [Firmicutes bacterium]|nr:aldo/keto reductase [Bacillota bacterium]
MTEFSSGVSSCSLGTWAIGGKGWGRVDDNDSIDTIRYAVEHGINMIDTAPVYGLGHSEEVVGRAVKGIRDKVLLVTKCGLIWDDSGNVVTNNSRKVLLKEIEDSLRRLDTEYVDLYLIHWPEDRTPFEETFSTLAEIRQSGKARHIGVCNFSPRQLEEAGKTLEIEFLQSLYNMFERDIEKEVLPCCREKGIPMMVYTPIAQGLLTGKYGEVLNFSDDDVRLKKWYFQGENYPKSLRFVEKLKTIGMESGLTTMDIAIAWTLKDKTVATALCGAKKREQIDGIVSAMNAKVSAETLIQAEEAYRQIFG